MTKEQISEAAKAHSLSLSDYFRSGARADFIAGAEYAIDNSEVPEILSLQSKTIAEYGDRIVAQRKLMEEMAEALKKICDTRGEYGFKSGINYMALFEAARTALHNYEQSIKNSSKT